MNYFPKILSQYVFSTNVVVIVFILFFIIMSSDVYGERYISYSYKFEPLPKYETTQKPRPGRYTFLKDIHVWVYKRKFAERFGMPEKWIDESLIGAEAITYRIETLNEIEDCERDANRNEICRPKLSCVYDVYITDEASEKLPWETSISAEPAELESSFQFLSPQNQEDYWYWTDEVLDYKYIYRGIKGLRSISYVSGNENSQTGEVFRSSGEMQVREYRRAFFQGLSLLELNSCNMVKAENPLRIYFLSPKPSTDDPKYRLENGDVDQTNLIKATNKYEQQLKSGNPIHKVVLPDAFMKKVREHDKVERSKRAKDTEARQQLQAEIKKECYKCEKSTDNNGILMNALYWIFAWIKNIIILILNLIELLINP